MSAWTDHFNKWKDCQLCPLSKQRDMIVIARGEVPCEIVFVGEAPGASENTLGLPFKGEAGHRLDAILSAAWNLCGQVPSYALTNLVCCFPAEAKKTKDHQPKDDEIRACRGRLREFINDVAKPRLIIAVGALADTYLPVTLPEATFYAGSKVSGHPTIEVWGSIVHPARILRMPYIKRPFMEKEAAVNIARLWQKLFDPSLPDVPQEPLETDTTADIPF